MSLSLILLLIFANWCEASCPPQESILPCRCNVKSDEYQIWCTHSDLQRILDSIKSISQQISGPIDQMILENNHLPSLPGRAFHPLKIMRLMLRHNGLERVSGDFLAGLHETLMEIFIVEPRLRSLPQDSLSKLHKLQAVTIQTTSMKRLPTVSGLIKLRYIDVDSEALSELINFNNNPNLETVHIKSGKNLTRLESKLFEDLPKLTTVNITNCGLTWLHPRALTSLPNLKEISFVANKINDAGMVGRSIRDLPQLENVKLDFNNINRLEEASFVDLPTLKSLSLTNNRIKAVRRGAFHRVPSLKTLNLNRNYIRHFERESFINEGIQELFLVENDINNIKEVKIVLENLPKLMFLDLSYNMLELIQFGTLGGHEFLEELNLGYNKLHLIEKEAFMALPALRELKLKNNSLSDHLLSPMWNLPALKGLDLSGNFFRKLTPRLLTNLPSLKRFDVSQNMLEFIEPTSFLPTPTLEHINMSRNHLEFLHPATFRTLLNLYELDLSYNYLIEFIPNLPRGLEYLTLHHNNIKQIPETPSPDTDLPQLRLLDLNHNQIEFIPKNAFKTLPSLKKLYLGNNQIKTVDTSSFEGLNNLEILDLSANDLIDIKSNAFDKMPRLKRVDLKNNKLDLITDLFKTASDLKILNLNGNRLAEVSKEAFGNNLNLEELNVSQNVLVQFPESLKGLINLKKLDLTNNRIKYLPPDIVNSLMGLRELRLSHNFVNEIKENNFKDMKHLKILDLNNNEISYVSPNAIVNLPKLKTVNLSKNKIKEIPNAAFNNLLSLNYLRLDQNEITTIQSGAFEQIPHLIMLNLSNNNMNNLNSLRDLTSLEVLDLSNNKITKLTTTSLNRMEWLVELILDNNDICTVTGDGFNNMPRLRVISLKNNKLVSFPESTVQRLRGNIGTLDLNDNPLICTCSLLWLQAWAQESGQDGPVCSDGTLLTDMLIPRDSCTESERNKEITSPSCDSELLTNNNVQVLGKLNQQPTPEESDYFYDEYVDYPYNETKETGNTPTLYAAPRNKTVPQKIVNSPSSSGFTFFGVPLDLNGIFKGATTTKPAQRKAAIVNDPSKKTVNRIAMGNVQSNAMHGIERMRPPQAPELHGGFVPILPGSGGFKPIPDPRLTTTTEGSGSKFALDPVRNVSNKDLMNVTRVTKEITKLFPKDSILVKNVTTKVYNVEKQSHLMSQITFFNTTTVKPEEISTRSTTTTTTMTTTTTEKLTTSTSTVKPTEKITAQELKTSMPVMKPLFLAPKNPKFASKSTITKIASPHSQIESAEDNNDENDENNDVPDPQAHREDYNNNDGNNLSNASNHWYFVNYNKSNLEPYIGKVYNNNVDDNNNRCSYTLMIISCSVLLKNVLLN